MTATVQTFWNDAPLKAKTRAAARVAAVAVAGAAKARNPAPSKIRVTGPRKMTGAEGYLIGTTGLGHIFELGRTGGYPIQPGLRATRSGRVLPGRGGSQVAIKFTKGDGGFFRGAGFLGGPMGERPFMRPAAATFPEAYRRAAAASLSGGLLR